MKKTLLLAIVCSVLISCSKKGNDVKPETGINISGQLYPTVVIGSQTWTTVNYNGPDGSNYNETTVNNPVYGKLYTFAEVQTISPPTGWRIPTGEDFKKLFATLGAPNGDPYQLNLSATLSMMAKTTWTEGMGSNASGLNLVGTGLYDSSFGGFQYINLGFSTAIWGINSDNNTNAPICLIVEYVMATQPTPGVGIWTSLPTKDKYSVRFVKDN